MLLVQRKSCLDHGLCCFYFEPWWVFDAVSPFLDVIYVGTLFKCINGVSYSPLYCSKCLSIVAARMYGLGLAPNLALEQWNSLSNWSFRLLFHKIRCTFRSLLSIGIWRNVFCTSLVITNLLNRLSARMSNNFGCSGGPVSRQPLSEGTWLSPFDEQCCLSIFLENCMMKEIMHLAST